MSRLTLLRKTEAELAAFQTEQIGNTCSFHAVSSAIQLLLNKNFDPRTLSQEINQRWWRGQFMRVAPNWAVTPRMQTRIVRYLADKNHLPVSAAYHRSDPESLLTILASPDEDVIPIVTLMWLWRQAPPIYYGDSIHNMNKLRGVGGHSMILAAYDPEHWAGNQFPTPWGFVNSWRSHTSHLFWMVDADFRKAWRFWLPGVGPNALVLVSRKQHSS
jgi:hypothetical protein